MVVKLGFMPGVVACFSSLFHFCSTSEVQHWAEQHKKIPQFFHIYFYSVIKTIWIRATTAVSTGKLLLVCQNGFSEISTMHFKGMV